MTDRELLEMAAKAANYPANYETSLGRFWNPLTDDGDALRLAVKLNMAVDIRKGEPWTDAVAACGLNCREHHNGDPSAATRRAIVRAAAAIGKAMSND